MTTMRLLVPLALLLTACQSEGTVNYQENTDNFNQAPNNEVDILWVVDNSYSMIEEQTALINGFRSFAGQLEESQTVFQLGIITTSFDYDDPDRGALVGDPPFLTNADDYEAAFAARATVGTDGSDKEKGLEASLGALHPSMTTSGGPNEGFIRETAELLVIWVSDEDDCSDAGALEGQDGSTCYSDTDRLTPVEEVVQELREIKGDKALVSVGAIVGKKGASCPDVFEGKRYISTVNHMGGIVGNICDSDWSGILEDLGLNATGIDTRFQLSSAAQIDTIVVTLSDGTEVPQDAVNGWTYNEVTWWLEFHGDAVPARGEAFTVHYTVDPGKLEPGTTTATN